MSRRSRLIVVILAVLGVAALVTGFLIDQNDRSSPDTSTIFPFRSDYVEVDPGGPAVGSGAKSAYTSVVV